MMIGQLDIIQSSNHTTRQLERHYQTRALLGLSPYNCLHTVNIGLLTIGLDRYTLIADTITCREGMNMKSTDIRLNPLEGFRRPCRVYLIRQNTIVDATTPFSSYHNTSQYLYDYKIDKRNFWIGPADLSKVNN